MAFLVDSGNPWEKETPALCVTSAIHKSERPDKNLKEQYPHYKKQIETNVIRPYFKFGFSQQ